MPNRLRKSPYCYTITLSSVPTHRPFSSSAASVDAQTTFLVTTATPSTTHNTYLYPLNHFTHPTSSQCPNQSPNPSQPRSLTPPTGRTNASASPRPPPPPTPTPPKPAPSPSKQLKSQPSCPNQTCPSPSLQPTLPTPPPRNQPTNPRDRRQRPGQLRRSRKRRVPCLQGESEEGVRAYSRDGRGSEEGEG